MSKSRPELWSQVRQSVLQVLEPRLLLAATEMVSQGAGGAPANGRVRECAISDDGRFVAFSSEATNLVAGDTNGVEDIFVRNRRTGVTKRVSIRSNGGQVNGDSEYPAISANGRYVAFESGATNLVGGDTNGDTDIFVHDRKLRRTERVSVSGSGAQANDSSDDAALSGTGRYVVFSSHASNLVRRDTNGFTDIFVYDRQNDAIERVSVSSSGLQANDSSDIPKISANGRYVVFYSAAANLVAGDFNGTDDAFLHDRQTGDTELISVRTNGTQGNDSSFDPDISDDGRYVTFYSNASNLVAGDTNNVADIFLRDRQTGTTRRISVHTDDSEANSSSFSPVISADGRYVAFYSLANNLINSDTNGTGDVFLRTLATGRTRRVSVGTGGVQGNGSSWGQSISADGKLVAFKSRASNLVPGDSNGQDDAFVRTL